MYFEILSPESLNQFYSNTLTVAGILFPIYQAILFFVVEKSFNSLTHSRQYLIKQYILRGRITLLILVYIIIQSIFQTVGIQRTSSILYFIFIFIFSFQNLALLADRGYWSTINSNNYIPNWTERIPLMKQILYLKHAKFIQKIQFIIPNLIFFIPFAWSIYENNSYFLHEKSIFISIIISIIYSIILIYFSILEPSYIQSYLLKREGGLVNLDSQIQKWPEQKIQRETSIFEDAFKQSNVISKTVIRDNSDLFSISSNYFIKDNGEYHINVNILDVDERSYQKLKERFDSLMVEMFRKLLTVKSDVNSFAVSFHINLKTDYHNSFMRASRVEIENNQYKSDAEFINAIPSKLIANLFS